MNPSSAELRSLAARLIEHESGPRPNVRQAIEGAESVCRKLAAGMEPMVGSNGFHPLLTRAIHIVSFENSHLESVRTGNAAGEWLEGLSECLEGRKIDEVRDAVAAVLECSLELLGHFIGEDLAVLIVSEAWPDIPRTWALAAFQNGNLREPKNAR